MPRQARLDVPGALHHIMVRGIDKSNIFRDDEDKARFLERLGQNVEEGKCSVYAWVLTPLRDVVSYVSNYLTGMVNSRRLALCRAKPA